MKHTKFILGLIFIIALVVRFYAFGESVYFGFDTARDAYISQSIYTRPDLKIVGPPVSGDIGLFHGPLFWYFIGPFYLVSHGDPGFVSAVFRIINALGVFLVFGIFSILFSSETGLLSALLYAVSFEQSQYAFYVANPGPAVISMLFIFLGAVLIYRRTRLSSWGPYFLFGGSALSMQLNLMFAYTFIMSAAVLLVLKNSLSRISFKSWIGGMALSVALLSTYIISEIRNGFHGLITAFSLFRRGFSIMQPGTSKIALYMDKFLAMFNDNLLGTSNHLLLGLVAILSAWWLLYAARFRKNYRILSVWLLGWVFLMLMGGHTAYYTNAGLGVAVIGLAALILLRLFNFNKYLGVSVICLVVLANIRMIYFQSPHSLIPELVTQSDMKLADEYQLLDNIYRTADGRQFTVRATGIPYKVQTLWAYLFMFYGLPKYGYLPLWETGNIDGFPGTLPVPQKGTTCQRFLVREPSRGLPDRLINADIREENIFSEVLSSDSIGDFLLETRQAGDPGCRYRD